MKVMPLSMVAASTNGMLGRLGRARSAWAKGIGEIAIATAPITKKPFNGLCAMRLINNGNMGIIRPK